jgi:hypothetical protein
MSQRLSQTTLRQKPIDCTQTVIKLFSNSYQIKTSKCKTLIALLDQACRLRQSVSLRHHLFSATIQARIFFLKRSLGYSSNRRQDIRVESKSIAAIGEDVSTPHPAGPDRHA